MSGRVGVLAMLSMVLLGLAASESRAGGPRRRHSVPVRAYPHRTIIQPATMHSPHLTMRDLMPPLLPSKGNTLPSMRPIPPLPPRYSSPIRIEPTTSKERGVINGGRLIINEGSRRIEIDANKKGGAIKLGIPLNIP